MLGSWPVGNSQMNEDVLLIVVVFMLGLGGLLGIAYALDLRRQKHGPIGPALPRLGRMGRGLLWAARILVALMVFSITGAYVLRVAVLVWVTAGFLALYIVDGLAYRLVRLTGK